MVMLRYSGGRNTSGYSIITDPYTGAVDEGETLSCCHCQFTWIVKPGSGAKRGWCFRCNKPVCGKQGCLEHCTPFEKALEEMENRDRFHRQLDKLR